MLVGRDVVRVRAASRAPSTEVSPGEWGNLSAEERTG